MKVAILTAEQKEMLIGQQFAIDSFFNPIQDINDNWVISLTEINDCTNINYIWVQELTLIDYVPKIITI